jgi:acetyl esterase/lipase
VKFLGLAGRRGVAFDLAVVCIFARFSDRPWRCDAKFFSYIGLALYIGINAPSRNDLKRRPCCLMISGGSAGGYTTLCALTPEHGITFRAGASYYGVSDLVALARDTHKFESQYLDWLVGPYPQEHQTYVDRSPINHIDRLSVPVIFFQGADDKIVPPNQAEHMVTGLKQRGIPFGYFLFDGEQHGFRKAENIKRSLDAELYFYAALLLRSGLHF